MRFSKWTVSPKILFILRCFQLAIVVFFLALGGVQWYAHSHGSNLMDQAHVLMQAGDTASLQKAIPLYQQSAEDFEGASEHLNAGNCYYDIARVYRKLHQNAPALRAYQQALAQYSSRKPSDSDDADWEKKATKDRADTRLNMGVIYLEQKNFAQAMDASQQALQLYTAVDDTADVALANGNLGLTSLDEGIALYASKAWGKALSDFQQAQRFYYLASNIPDEAVSWHNISLCYAALSQPDKAADAIKQEKTLRSAHKA